MFPYDVNAMVVVWMDRMSMKILILEDFGVNVRRKYRYVT